MTYKKGTYTLSDHLALKLRVYPNQAQERLIFTYAKARQWAFHLGVELYKKEQKDYSFFRELHKTPKKVVQGLQFPRYFPKWKNKTYLSQLISRIKQDVQHYNETLASLIGSENASRHPLSFLNEVPRCILTQGLDDYQKCLNKAFKDMKDRIPVKQRAGFPTFYSLYKKKTFRYQIDRPQSNQLYLESWQQDKIRVGEAILRYKDPTKLPQSMPSLITVSQNPCGQYYASFLTKEPRTYKNPVQEAKRIKRKEILALLKKLSLAQLRSLAYDPNVQAEFFFDSFGLSFSMAEFDYKKKLEADLIKCAKHLSKTIQRNKKKGILQPSKRSLKAQKNLNKIYNDRNNAKEDYQQKLTSAIALFYPEQAREGLDVKGILEKNGKTQSRLRKDRSYKKYKLSRNFSHLAVGKQRALMAEKLQRIHGEKHQLITLNKYERTTQCCSVCKEERLTVTRDSKTWQCPYCQTIHIRDECAPQNTLDKGFNLESRKANKAKPKPIDFKLAFPDLELDPKTGFPVTRSTGLDVGKRRRFVKWESVKKEVLGEFETKLFEKLSCIGKLRVAQNIKAK